MNLKIGIVGLPNVGKSTLFNALTRKKVDISNYPFCTIEPNVGVVEVPDKRLALLAALARSKKIIPAVVEFVDIAGLMKGAAQGAGLGNKFLSHIRAVDALMHVVRIFADEEIIHVAGRLDPVSDIEVIEYELILKDLETATRRLNALQTEIRARKKGARETAEILEKFVSAFAQGDGADAVSATLSKSEREHADATLQELQFLTAKPTMYVFNVSEERKGRAWQPDARLAEKISKHPYVAICAHLESELAALADVERNEYLQSMGRAESGLTELIRLSYETLGLITFFTTGEDETRAWTIARGSTAPSAGRAIHSDFEKKFIRAEVIHCEKLLQARSFARAREMGLLRIEGKEYTLEDGDVIEFKI